MALRPDILLNPQVVDAGQAVRSGLQTGRGIAQAPMQNRLLQAQVQQAEQQTQADQMQLQAQKGRHLLNAATALRGISDPTQRQATLELMAPELVDRFGVKPEELANGLDDAELDNVITSLQQFAPPPLEAKVGRFRTFEDDSGVVRQLDTATGKTKIISRPEPINISALPEDVQAAVKDAPRDVQKKVVQQFASPATIEKTRQEQASKAQKVADAQAAINQIDELFKGDVFKDIHGSFQGITPTVRETSVDAEAARDQIVGLLSLESRQKLKGQGTITDSEAATLEKSATILANPRISDSAAARELNRVRKVFEDARSRAGGKPEQNGPQTHTSSAGIQYTVE